MACSSRDRLAMIGLAGAAALTHATHVQQADQFPSVLELSELDGIIGFRLDGHSERGFSGSSVAPAGDVNGDGVDDIIIGARFDDPDGRQMAGSSFVVFGRRTDQGRGFDPVVQLTDLDGTNGFKLIGPTRSLSGRAVACAGDLNSDGIDDIIIGAPDARPVDGGFQDGSSYVVFGRDTTVGKRFPKLIDLTALDGTDGFRMDGGRGDSSGSSVAAAGDVNGDGIEDLLIGAPNANPGKLPSAGSIYVLFGRNTANDGTFPSVVKLPELNGRDGFRINGFERYALAGYSVASAGDVNADGVADIVVGARRASPGGLHWAGCIYVVFGRDATAGATFPAALSLDQLHGVQGFSVQGFKRDGGIGASVACAGDINGDGVDDIIIGAQYASPFGRTEAGSSYVVFGRGANDPAFPAALRLNELDESTGFRLDGVNRHDRTGHSVAAAGDVDADGVNDIIVGAFRAAPQRRNDAGSSFVVFGRDASDQQFPAVLDLADLDGTVGFRINGAAQGDNSGRSVAAAGDVNGDGIPDIIIGAPDAYPSGRERAGSTYVLFGRSRGR
ncbi:MAG: integrin alpha [Phycisphaerales bacterium]